MISGVLWCFSMTVRSQSTSLICIWHSERIVDILQNYAIIFGFSVDTIRAPMLAW
jgi:hypothetical protein